LLELFVNSGREFLARCNSRVLSSTEFTLQFAPGESFLAIAKIRPRLLNDLDTCLTAMFSQVADKVRVADLFTTSAV